MIMSVYLHKQVADLLMCYGKIDDVVNKILSYGEKDEFDLMNMPMAPSRDGASRYNINITNQYYLDLLSIYGVNSPRLSLRRILYWFVENEKYCEYGWKCEFKYNVRGKESQLKKVEVIKSNLIRLSNNGTVKEKEQCKILTDDLSKLEEIIKNGR